MDDSRKVIVVKSAGSISGQGTLYWMFSRKQLEMVLREIDSVSVGPAAGDSCRGIMAWQDELLPVVCLEQYYGLVKAVPAIPQKHLVLKAAAQRGDAVSVSMLVMPVYTDLQLGSVSGGGRAVEPDFLRMNGSDILGAFELSAQKFVVLPDICRIAERLAPVVSKQGSP